MPLTWAIREPPRILVTASGVVTFEEARAMEARLLAEAVGPCSHILVDARAVTGAPSTDELRILAEELKPLIDAGLGAIAILCASNFVYGIARMFAAQAEVVHATVAAFRDEREAREWLDHSAAA